MPKIVSFQIPLSITDKAKLSDLRKKKKSEAAKDGRKNGGKKSPNLN